MPRKKRTTIKDVARAAGVSHPTASRILNNKLENYPLRKETIERVRQAAKDLQYRPNHFAQSLKTRSSNILGLSLPGLPRGEETEVWNEEMIWSERPDTWVDLLFGSAYCNWLNNRHFAVIQRPEDSEETILDDILPGYVDGAVICTPGKVLLEPGSILDNDNRVVALCTPPPGSRFSSCDVNNRHIAHEVARLLLDAGARKILYVYDMPPSFHVSREIWAGFTQALDEFGLEPDESLCFTKPRIQYGTEEMRQWLRERLAEPNHVDGVMLASWLTINVFLDAMQASGRSFPDDLLVAGIASCGIDQAKVHGISAVHLPIADIAFQANKLLIEQLDGKLPGYRHIEVPHRLELRASTGHTSSQR